MTANRGVSTLGGKNFNSVNNTNKKLLMHLYYSLKGPVFLTQKVTQILTQDPFWNPTQMIGPLI